MKTSIILCTRNRPTDVLLLTESLCEQSALSDVYVVVYSSYQPLPNVIRPLILKVFNAKK